MAVEEELKRDHAEMQAVIEVKQKVIDAQVPTHRHWIRCCLIPEPTAASDTLLCLSSVSPLIPGQ